MKGSKNEYKRIRYECKYGLYSGGWDYHFNYNKKLRRLPVTVEIPDGNHYRKFFTFFDWGG